MFMKIVLNNRTKYYFSIEDIIILNETAELIFI